MSTSCNASEDEQGLAQRRRKGGKGVMERMTGGIAMTTADDTVS